MRTYFTLFICLMALVVAQAQQQYSTSDVTALIMSQAKQELTIEDLSTLKIDKQYTSDKTGVTYIYVLQTVDGIPIHNAVTSIAISKDKKTTVVNSSFLSGLKSLLKSNGGNVISVDKATRAALAHENVATSDIQLDRVRSSAEISKFTSGQLTDAGASAKLVYTLVDNELILTWDVSFFPKRGTDFWSSRIDAASGELVDQSSFTVHCQFDSAPGHVHSHSAKCHVEAAPASTMLGDGAQYNVFALPVESPLHGARTLLNDPADAVASPHGWHDLNGLAGNETVVTEGNNVMAWLDRLGDYSADRDVTGGSDLIFDFDYDGLTEPTAYQDASTTNLFYMVNMMHDFTHAYGFDEQAGNFQENNYGNGGAGQDAVVALAQFNGESGGNLNNADFSTPNDGGSGTMRMFLWNTRNDISVFNVESPSDVAGPYPSRTAAFGPTIDSVAFVGEVVLIDDETGVITDGCQEIRNDAEVEGKIAMIDRGDCEFGVKILNAEDNGAIGVIICNNVSGLLGGQMGAGAVGGQVTIPSVFLSKEVCEQLRVYAGTGLVVKFQTPAADDQPDRVDGSLDNGIIAHEFGHGISNRLTGGPNQSNCLSGSSVGTRQEGEQMGEGWSDFFGLVLTVEPGDIATDPRGIGNYAQRNPIDGPGIRTYPYSTDMSVNPVTYYSTYEASIPHGVGQVWCSMIWDMYWLFVDRYGWDADVIHGEGGNNKAILLVMEGLKLQACNPGFVDGRDAILAADMMLCNGVNQDIIWEAFARRGLGQFADQGSSVLTADGREDYSIPNQYIKSVKLIKTMTPTIEKGENIAVSLEVRNDLSETVNDIEVIDLIPSGTQVVMATLPSNASVSGEQITFAIPSLDSATQMLLNYELSTPLIPSKTIVYDDLEGADTDGARWITNGISGNRDFQWSTGFAYSGDHAWEIANIGNNTEQAVFTFFETPITGTIPMARFAHNFSMDDGNDGGIMEITTDAFNSLQDLGDHFIRNPYNNNLRNDAFPDNIESGFTGSSGDWILSYVDLSAYLGETAYFQYRFSSDANGGSDFWSFDDFTVFEALVYNSEACLNYNGATDAICASAPEYGTIVEPEAFSSTKDRYGLSANVNIYPNPAADLVTIETDQLKGMTEVNVIDFSGRTIWSQTTERIQDQPRFVISLEDWSTGVYLVELRNNEKFHTEKIVKK